VGLVRGPSFPSAQRLRDSGADRQVTASIKRRTRCFLPQRLLTAVMALGVALAPIRLAAEISPTEGRELIAPPVYQSMQKWMLDKRFDGWLLTGQGTFDAVEGEFLGLKGQTRHRWFIFYGAMATLRQPFLIYHPDDEKVFTGVKFYPTAYRSYAELKQALTDRVFSVARDIAIDYSPRLEVSEISRIDLGTVELLQEIGLKFRPAGSMLSFYTRAGPWTRCRATNSPRPAGLCPAGSGRIPARPAEPGQENHRLRPRAADRKKPQKTGPGSRSAGVVAVGRHTLEESHAPLKDNRWISAGTA